MKKQTEQQFQAAVNAITDLPKKETTDFDYSTLTPEQVAGIVYEVCTDSFLQGLFNYLMFETCQPVCKYLVAELRKRKLQ